MGQQIRRHLAYRGAIEPIAFAQLYRTVWAVEQEHGFTSRADHMGMWRRMVVRGERDPQATKAQDRGHAAVLPKTQAIGNCETADAPSIPGWFPVTAGRYQHRVRTSCITETRQSPKTVGGKPCVHNPVVPPHATKHQSNRRTLSSPGMV